MIGIINYNAGNIKSVINSVTYCTDEKVTVANHPGLLKDCSKIILPGVGAFGKAMKSLNDLSFTEMIHEEVKKGKYLLGICLGMQLLATRGYEFGEWEGLNLIDAESKILWLKDKQHRVPHVGWNNVRFVKKNPILDNIKDNSDFYFVHSYYLNCEDRSNVIGETEHGIKFAALVNHDNVFGVQFHPEKSQTAGLQLIRNFLELK